MSELVGFNPQIDLTKEQYKRIGSFKHNFMEAEGITNVPWEALVGIWYRESFSVAPPKTPGGPFQFDPPLTHAQIFNLLAKFTTLQQDQLENHAQSGVNDFRTALLCCACWLRAKCKPIITPQSSDVDIKDAMYGYNGRAYGSVENSPYVMNGYSRKHIGPDGAGMRFSGTIPDGHGGRKKVSGSDRRPGAFTIYALLKSKSL